MYNQDYEDYMRNVLGYTPNYQENTYRDLGANGNNYYFYNNDFFQQPVNSARYENMYPEIYRKIQPLIIQEINANTRNITEDIIDEMVDRVYEQISTMRGDTEIIQEKVETKNINSSNTTKTVKEEVRENRGDRSNNFLRDLIKILLLKEVIIRPPRPPRPCFGPGNCPGVPGPRPPFPGGPGMPPPMPRDYYM